MSYYAPLRLKDLKPSLFDPHYTDRRLLRDMIESSPWRKSARILDYGAGNSPYRPLFTCQEYLSADVEQNAEGQIQYLINPDSPHLPLADGSVDLVLMMDVLEHIRCPHPALKEIRRLLSQQGRLLIKIPFIYREHESPQDFRRLTEFGLKELLREHGMEVQELKKMGNAWTCAIILITERFVMDLEKQSWWTRLTSALLRFLVLPVLNLFLPNITHEGTYSCLVAVAVKAPQLPPAPTHQ